MFEEICPMDEHFQVTDEFRELNANLITCIKHLEQYGITLMMLMQFKETKKLEEKEKAVHSYLIENITTCVAKKPYYLKQKEEFNRQIEEMCHNNENFRMTNKFHESNKKLELIKRLEQAKQAAQNNFKTLQKKYSDKILEQQRAQAKGDQHPSPNISTGIKVINFHNFCLKLIS